MKMSDSIKTIVPALVKAQSEMRNALKNSANPHFRSTFADLESVFDACKEPLLKNGISFAQPTGVTEHGMVLFTILMHESGEFLIGEYLLNPAKPDPQGFGSALTYARRYALSAMVGIAQTDDDGNLASFVPQQQPVEKKMTPPPPVQVGNGGRIPSPVVVGSIADRPITFGAKFKGKKYGEIPLRELEAYATYFMKEKKNQTPEFKQFFEDLQSLRRGAEPESADRDFYNDERNPPHDDGIPF